MCRANSGRGSSSRPQLDKKRTWALAARTDLKAIYELLADNHPGPVDDLNPAFKWWHDEGLRQALDLARREVNSAAGYYFNLRFYVSGFRDTHLNLSSNLILKPKWPGFVVALRNGKFVVCGRRSARRIERIVAPGETFSPREWLLRNVFPYAGNPELEASWVEFSPWLLVDLGNPWTKRPTAVLYDGNRRPTPLRWRSIPISTLNDLIEDAQFGPRPPFALREFSDNCIWISLPTFRPTGEDRESLKQIIRSLPERRNATVIVFDVRGNRGGNSQWGSDVLRALYGDAYYEFRRQTLQRLGTYVEWRASRQNHQYINRRAQELEREFGRGSPIVRMMRTVDRKIQRAVERGKVLCQHRDSRSVAALGRRPVNPVKDRVFLLTDGRCGSSCLDFADELFAMQTVKHVGFPTNADSNYAEVRSEVLPSSISRLTFAMKVYRHRVRPANTPYLVQHRWSGEIADTEALEQWILKLARRRKPSR